MIDTSLRFVQLTPPGSACSIVLGTGLTEMTPGSQRGIMMVVPHADDALQHLTDHGVPAWGVEDL